MRCQIVAALNGQQPALNGFSLTVELEIILLGALGRAEQSGARAPLDNFPVEPNVLSQLQMHMPAAAEQMKQLDAPPVLLVIPRIRPMLARYAKLFAPGLVVLSCNETPENKEVSIVATLG
ncbi:FHIPEP family type III secretion protein [Burkholderia pyrrocinia]|uniref:FHIPEP family type III secretion protein n=1 Tax=Burkholderia pyrrocinia TaxID=60550 RepID=UPI003D769CD8